LRPIERIAKLVNLEPTLEEASDRLLEELDYRLEAQNLSDFERLFAGDPAFVIPSVHGPVRRTVLLMDLLEGLNVRDYMAGEPALEERRRYGESILRFGWASVFEHGLLHADPNPGNYLFDQHGRLGVVDFGCVKRFGRPMVDGMRRVVAASRSENEAQVRQALVLAGVLPEAATPALSAAVVGSMLAWAAPFRGQDYDFGDPAYLQSLLDAQSAFRRALQGSAGFPFPRDWLFYARHLIGGASMLYRLRVRGNFGGLLEQFA
jgi:predicted unusual protein kinase regulating ubiquinone biosynthesis (AarF/ABC1/UbiB family)